MLAVSIVMNCPIIAQNQPQSEEYTYGVFSHLPSSANYQRAKAYLDSAGFNIIVDGIVPDTTTTLNQSLIGIKENSPEDYIAYYSKGYYSKWEAENEEFAFGKVWFKHPYKIGTTHYNHYVLGQVETHQGSVCWATQREAGYWIDSVLWGPHYHQDKEYDFSFEKSKITYIASYRLAFSNIPQKSLDTEVCRLKVTYSYRYGEYPDTHIVVRELSSKTLRVGDFPSDESFRNFTISYQLPDRPTVKDRRLPENWIASADTVFEDDVPLSGVEFKLEWSGIGKLFIDYVEVYDSLVWGDDFIDPLRRELIINNIKTYAINHQNITKLRHWFVNDESNSIDTYLPMRIVDSLVNTVTAGKNTITEIYPHWRGELNGEHHLKQFVQISNTKKLMIDMYPAYVDQPYWKGIDFLRKSLQWAWEAQPNFWYVAQAFGQQKDETYCQWRRINATELNASLLLALSHGAKGIFFWHYQPNYSNGIVAICDSQIVYFSALLDSLDRPTELYDYIRFNFTPRINGKLQGTINYKL